MLMDKILPVTLLSHQEVLYSIAEKVRHLRLANEWTRDMLARQSGVSVSSIKRFEREGKISFDKLLAIAFALDAIEEFQLLFPEKKIQSIKDLQQKKTQRKRGKRKNAN